MRPDRALVTLVLVGGCVSSGDEAPATAGASFLRQAAWTDTWPQNPDDGLGWLVSAAGDVNGDGLADVIVGGLGFAVVYHGSTGGLDKTPSWDHQYPQPYINTETVAPAGDVNGDGFDDIVVGRWNKNIANLYLGSATGVQESASWKVTERPNLGFFTAGAGDLNGDGFDDVTFSTGLPCCDESHGRVLVFYGAAALPERSDTIDWVVGWKDATPQGQAFQFSTGPAGDVDGDGFDDLLVGAQWLGGDPADRGGAFVFPGSASGLVDAGNWRPASEQLGEIVSRAGDVNGDGFDDVIVAAWNYDNAFINAGRIDVYHGSAQGPEADPAWSVEGEEDRAQISRAAPLGDINGDGFDDIAVLLDWLTSDWGVFLGSASGLSATSVGSFAPVSPNELAGAGDVNGDGYDDIIAGNTYDSELGIDEEATALLFLGGPSGP